MRKNFIYSLILIAACILLLWSTVPAQTILSNSIDFGDVEIGASAQRTFTLWNTGTIELKNCDLKISAPFFIDSPTTRFSISPGDSITVYVSFRPGEIGAVNNTV